MVDPETGICENGSESQGSVVAADLDSDGERNDSSKQATPDYQLPEWFVSQNVKLPTELQYCETKIEFSTQIPSKNAQDNQRDKDAVEDSQLDGKDAVPKYQISYDRFLELRDTVAAALVRNEQGNLSPFELCVVLRSPSSSSSSSDRSLEFLDALLVHLAQDMQATLISFDKEDLEDLGYEFDRQEPPMSPITKGREPTIEEHISGNPATDLAAYYFAVESERHASTEAWNRNRRAICAILDAPRSKPELVSPSQNTVPPTLIYVRDAMQMMDGHKDFRIFARLRDSIQERREYGGNVVLIISAASWFCDYGNNDSIIRRKVGASKGSTATMDYTDTLTQDNTYQCAYNSARNIGRLKRILRWRIPHALSEEVLQSFSDWSQGFDNNLCLGNSLWSRDEILRAATQVTGRAWRKSHLDLEDIRIVLVRMGLYDTANDISTVQYNQPPHSESSSEEPVQSKAEAWNEKLRDIETNCDDLEKELTSCIINPDEIDTSYDDVIMEQDSKDLVRHLLSLSELRIECASSFIMEHIRIKGVLLYGAPGTGKTHLSRAIAKESGANMLAIDSASVQSRWVGETEKYIKAAFGLAAKLAPCVLFIDEVDALFYRRSSSDRSWERSALTQFLHEMDGLGKSNTAPFVVVATNRPSDLDEAFLRRLPQKVLFRLPEVESRSKILQLFLKKDDLDQSVDIDQLARNTEGYSGSDLQNLCAEAALIWAIEQLKITPSVRSLETSLKVQLSIVHFEKALKRIRPSVSPEALRNLAEFARRFNAHSFESLNRGIKSMNLSSIANLNSRMEGLLKESLTQSFR